MYCVYTLYILPIPHSHTLSPNEFPLQVARYNCFVCCRSAYAWLLPEPLYVYLILPIPPTSLAFFLSLTSLYPPPYFSLNHARNQALSLFVFLQLVPAILFTFFFISLISVMPRVVDLDTTISLMRIRLEERFLLCLQFFTCKQAVFSSSISSLKDLI